MNSTIYIVGAGPGDPELITLKGDRLLQEADLVVYAGSLVNPQLLERLKPECRIRQCRHELRRDLRRDDRGGQRG